MKSTPKTTNLEIPPISIFRLEPRPRTNQRLRPASSFRKEHRYLPIDQVENQLVIDGIYAAPSDFETTDDIPHFRMAPAQLKPKAKKQKQKAKPKNKTPVAPPVQRSAAPVAIGTRYVMGKPKFTNVGTDLVVEHMEYCFAINGATVFSTTSALLNPGNTTLFPWLAAIAQRFESYIFDSFQICYEPLCSTATDGAVYIGIDYNSQDPLPTSVRQLMTYEGTVRSSAFMPACMVASKQGLSKRKTYYVSGNYLEPIAGDQLYDTGKVIIASDNSTVAATNGEIYVKYRVRLSTPEMNTETGSEARSCRYSGASNILPLGNNVANVNGISTYMPAVGDTPFYASVSGTTTSVITFTCAFAWTGYLTISNDGTGIASQSVTGSATIINIGGTYTPATDICTILTVSAQRNNTIIITTANTTLTGSTIVFAEGSLPL